MGSYGERGEWAFIPVSVGLFLGASFVYSADLLLPSLGVSSPLDLVETKKQDTETGSGCPPSPPSPGQDSLSLSNGLHTEGELRQRYKPQHPEDTTLYLNTQTNPQHHNQVETTGCSLLQLKLYSDISGRKLEADSAADRGRHNPQHPRGFGCGRGVWCRGQI